MLELSNGMVKFLESVLVPSGLNFLLIEQVGPTGTNLVCYFSLIFIYTI